MIDLTPLEVRKKKGDFRRGMRGYDPQAVDDFLDLVADRLEQLVRENASVTDRMTRIEGQVNDYRERERALTEALVTAQEMREEMRKQVEREVDLKRREAEADADSIRSEAAQVREREEESIRRLRARQSQFVQSYRAFLERELSELAVMAESLDLSRSVTSEAPPRKVRKRPEAETAAAPAPAPTPAPTPTPTPAPAPARQRERQPGPVPTPVAMPVAEVAREPKPEALSLREPDFERDLPPAPSGDRSIDAMLNELPPFAGVANVTQMEMESPPANSAAAAEEEAEVLADVRAEFDELVAEDLPLLEPEPEEEVLDLVDDVADDEDADGWMSTLLEGKGDKRNK